MFLAVDVGNTHTTFGLMEGQNVLRESRITTQRHQTADELQVILRFLAGIEEVPRDVWVGAAICSVVPAFNRTLKTAIERVIAIKPDVLTPFMKLDVENEYNDPREVGMDRLANAVAGIEKYGPGLVVVDFGTATTLDIISNEGHYLGGVILPGLEATADALYIRTSKLPQISIERPEAAFGRTTVQAMLSGLFFGSIDAVEGAIGRIESQLGYGLKVVATGGLAKVLAPDMKRLDAVDDYLTLRGIESIWRKNQNA